MARYKTLSIGGSSVAYSPCPDRSPTLFIPLNEYVQQDCYCCGWLASLVVAEYLIPGITAKKVLSVIRPVESYGTTRTKIINGLGELGIDATYKDDLTISKLVNLVKFKIPVIIAVWPDSWIGDHWCVVRGFSKGMVHLVNHYNMGFTSFKREWIYNYGGGWKTGAGLICTLR